MNGGGGVHGGGVRRGFGGRRPLSGTLSIESLDLVISLIQYKNKNAHLPFVYGGVSRRGPVAGSVGVGSGGGVWRRDPAAGSGGRGPAAGSSGGGQRGPAAGSSGGRTAAESGTASCKVPKAFPIFEYLLSLH